MRAEEKAYRLPVLISIPLVACMLPTMIGTLMLPAVVMVVRMDLVVAVLVTMIVVVVVVVVVRVLVAVAMPARGVGAPLGFEGLVRLCDDEVLLPQHVGQHVVGLEL